MVWMQQHGEWDNGTQKGIGNPCVMPPHLHGGGQHKEGMDLTNDAQRNCANCAFLPSDVAGFTGQLLALAYHILPTWSDVIR